MESETPVRDLSREAYGNTQMISWIPRIQYSRLTDRLDVLFRSFGRSGTSEKVQIQDSSKHIVLEVSSALWELDVHSVRVEQEDTVCRRVLAGDLVDEDGVGAVKVGVCGETVSVPCPDGTGVVFHLDRQTVKRMAVNVHFQSRRNQARLT